MTDFVKKKIVEKLAKFTKDLKPSDISLGFLTGRGVLTNLELNCDFITEALQLPPWIRVTRVMCDTIRAHVPFTSLRNEPIQIAIGTVEIEVSTTTDDDTTRTTHSNLLDKLGSNSPSKYGFTEKVIDGMKVEIRSIIVYFHDPTYRAKLEITDIIIQSTNPQWKPATLAHTRYKNIEEDSVIIYKMCSIGNLKIEGWSFGNEGGGGGGGERRGFSPGDENSRIKLRLIAGETNIRVTLKRLIEDCSILHTRVVVRLGDIMWILSQSQLQAVSRLMQTLIDAAVHMAQRRRLEREGDDSDSVSGESVMSEEGLVHGADGKKTKSSRKRSDSKSEKKPKEKKGLSPKEVIMKQKMYDYRSGKQNIPVHEVIQDSVHVQTGNIDLQFCNDSKEEEKMEREGNGRPQSQRSTVEGSLLVRLKEVQVDVYLDQPAGSGKCHWNKANELILRNVRWSEGLIKRASRTQHMDLPSVSLQYLHERGIVIRCADYTVESLCCDPDTQEAQLPLITSDKKTFNIPENIHNPAFQVGITLYFYPEAYGTKFLIPRPNVYFHCSPLHATLHQQSVLWIMEFVHGVVSTINLDLAMSVHTEGRAFLEERKAQSVPTHQLSGVDLNFKILFTKVTLPLPNAYSDGRPRALQMETASINIQNHSLDTLLQDRDFKSALDSVDNGWVFSTHGSGEFPHFPGDFPCVPQWLRELLNYKLRDSRRGMVAELPTSPLERSSSPIVVQNSELMHTEAWHIHTACVHLSFTKSDKYEDTLRPKDFVDDFPLHLWLFLPRQRREGEDNFHRGAPQHSTPTTQFSSERGTTQEGVNIPSIVTPGSSQHPLSSNFTSPLHVPTATPLDNHPMISFIAHVSDPICAELERLQLLFLMRLKDSFTELKSSMMKFLTLTSEVAVEESLHITTTTTPRVFGRRDTSVDDVEGGREGGEQGAGLEEQRSGGGSRTDCRTASEWNALRNTEAVELLHSLDALDSSEQDSNTKNLSASIAGCVIVRSLQADILLPSIFTDKSSKVVGSGKNTPVNTPLSPPSSPLPPPSCVPDHSDTLSPCTPTRLLSPTGSSLSPSLPSPITHTHVEPQPGRDLPRTLAVISQPLSGSQSSLVSQTSQTSSTSQTSYSVSQVRLPGSRLESGQTGSQTSLPILFETGRWQSGDDQGSDATSLQANVDMSPPQLLQSGGGHGRSLSATNIAPSFGKTTPTLAPSSLANISSVPDITVQSLEGGNPSPHSRHTPHTLTNTEEGYVMVHVPLAERRGLNVDSRSLGGEDGLEVGREMRENSPYVVPQLVPDTVPSVDVEESFESELRSGEVEGGSVERGEGVKGGGGEGERFGGGEGVGEGVEGRERASSFDRREMDDTLTPLTGKTSPRKQPPLRRESMTSLHSTSSAKREKPPPLLRSEPQFVVRINIRGIAALPNIQANEISLRASIGGVKLAELRAIDRRDEREKPRYQETECTWGEAPVIRARFEVGSQVDRFNLPPSSINEKLQDMIMMLSISGLETGLLLRNAPVLKDFFDDEYEEDSPFPIQIRIEDTSLMLAEDLDSTAETDSTMNVCIKVAEIYRGPKIENTNLFTNPVEPYVPAELETLHLSTTEAANLRETSPAAASTDSSASAATNPDLLQTFRSFINVFESHVRRHGGLKVQLNQPEHIAGLLQELQVSLSEEERNLEQRKSGDAPPSYLETVWQDENSTLQTRAGNASPTLQSRVGTSNSPPHKRRSSGDCPATKARMAELQKLRRDSQELARIQAENDDLIQQLMQTKMLLAERSQDLDEVTSECKKAKDDLVTHKQVLENYQEHIERLLTENADLKVLTALPQ